MKDKLNVHQSIFSNDYYKRASELEKVTTTIVGSRNDITPHEEVIKT